MKREYKVINSFMCAGTAMVMVRTPQNSVCTMTEEEWKRLIRRNTTKR